MGVGSFVVLLDVFQGFEKRRSEAAMNKGEFLAESCLDLGLGKGVWNCQRLVQAAGRKPWRSRKRGRDVNEDDGFGGGFVENCWGGRGLLHN